MKRIYFRITGSSDWHNINDVEHTTNNDGTVEIVFKEEGCEDYVEDVRLYTLPEIIQLYTW